MDKKKWIEGINVFILISVIALSVYLLFLGEEQVSSLALSIGYVGIAIFTFFLDVSFQLISPDIFVISGMIGGLNIFMLLGTVIISSLFAGVVSYYLGSTYSKSILHSLLGVKKAKKSIKYFKKYGKWGMAIIALTPIPYLPIIGGIFKMRIRDFFIYALLMRVLHFIILAGIMRLIV